MKNISDAKIAIVGLGYVGLPLALAFARKYPVTGFDISEDRIRELSEGYDRTKELSADDLGAVADNMTYTTDKDQLAGANIYVLALPTPVNEFNVPDFDALISATEAVAPYLSEGDVVIYESTVYPGATREICVPALERASGKVFNEGFYVGYSPERVSPADKSKVEDIVKVTSGSTLEIAKYVDELYASVITAGTHSVSSMEAAEACKVIENAQRDVNIGFMNEVAMLMNHLDIDTQEVIGAMKTKWNALNFVPGLVGGHCIGIDPYYLVHKAQQVGHNMGIMKATRNVNDGMGFYVAERIIKIMAMKGIGAPGTRALMLGMTFKENCPDIRNARPLDIKRELEGYNINVDVYDPMADPAEVKGIFDFDLVTEPENGTYDLIVIAVGHDDIKAMDAEQIGAFGKENRVIFDIKSLLPREASDGRL